MNQTIAALWRKLFFSPYFFTIALRRKAGGDILSDPGFAAEYVFPATPHKWAADPILVDHQGETYLFYEAVYGTKGRIEVVKVYEDCTVSEPTVILEDECHYSYPFVFRYQQDWYMIPESSASEEVCLYKAVEFPVKWEKENILLHQKSVDTTVFEQNGNLWLLTFLLCPGTEYVRPQAYRMDWNQGYPVLIPVIWENWDGLKSRGAGPLFLADGNLIRPAQRNEENQYGNGLLFYRVQPGSSSYAEVQTGSLSHEQVQADGIWLDGLHTYTVSEKFEAIDIRCRAFDVWKVLRVLWNKLCKK